MRRFFLAGNWKMNMTSGEAYDVATKLKKGIESRNSPYEIVICPPYTALFSVKDAILGSKIHLGAQNVHWEDRGAYTGEISLPMLREIGVQFVIVGHSERRKYFCETDETVNLKLKKVLESDITPIFCIGETLEERKTGRAQEVVKRQIEQGLNGIPIDKIKRIIIAYEPVWAIGTGVSASESDIDEMHRFIRALLEDMGGASLSEEVSILYGGSVKPENVRGITEIEDVDGALIGGASLKPESFLGIIDNAGEKKR
mgnify:CR=1 FL=1